MRGGWQRLVRGVDNRQYSWYSVITIGRVGGFSTHIDAEGILTSYYRSITCLMRRRRTSVVTRRQARSTRRSRWIVVVGGPLTVPPSTYQTISLLSPIIPPSTLADQLYQQMTKPTVIAIMGHFTLGISNPIVFPGLTPNYGCEYAWGIYRDVDISSSTTDLPAYSSGYSNSWMIHKAGALATPAMFNSNSPAYTVGQGQNDWAYRRYELNLRRYKRVMDSANDTLILSVENNPGLAPSANQGTFSFSFYFRMLLLE